MQETRFNSDATDRRAVSVDDLARKCLVPRSFAGPAVLARQRCVTFSPLSNRDCQVDARTGEPQSERRPTKNLIGELTLIQ